MVIIIMKNMEELEIGFKSGWCVMDLTEFINPPVGGCNTYNCGYQGITAGCADIYHSGLDCQWLDLTEIPDVGCDEELEIVCVSKP